MSLADIFCKKIVGSISSYYIYISINYIYISINYIYIYLLKFIYLNSNVVIFSSPPSPL